MKKLIVIIAILLCSPFAYAGMQDAHKAVIARMNVASGGCDSCTDGLVFAWYANDPTVGDTGYTPCGCSVGDSEGTANDSVTIAGTAPNRYVDASDAGKYFAFDVGTGGTSLFPDSGSVLIKFQIDTYNSQASIFTIYFDASNFLSLDIPSQNDIGFRWVGQTSGVTKNLLGGNAVIDTDFWIVFRWETDSGVTPDGLAIELYSMEEVEIESGTNQTNLTAMTVTPGDGDLRVGESTGTNEAALKIYEVHIYDTYAGAPTSGF